MALLQFDRGTVLERVTLVSLELEMFSERTQWALNVASYILAALFLAWAIWWLSKQGWPNPYGLLNIGRLQIYMFMAAPFGILIAIVTFFYGRKK
jgi:hypothetical protein